MATVYEYILKEISAYAEGTLFGPKRFQKFGSPSSVRRALRRLCEEGKLENAYTGVYATPIAPKWGAQSAHRSAGSITEFLSMEYNLKCYPHGATAVNLLGLSTQVVCGWAYSTPGKSRIVHIGNATVKFSHVPKWQIMFGESPEGIALLAVGYIGKKNFTPELFEEIAKKLPESSLNNLIHIKDGSIPGWVSKIIKQYGMNK